MPALLLLIAYPLLTHAAVIQKSPFLEWLALIALTLLFLRPQLVQKKVKAWLAFISIGVLLAAIINSGWARHLLQMPPIAIPLITASGFAHSLLPGNKPWISSMAEIVHGPLNEELQRYTRMLTWFWALFLFSMAIWDAALAFWGSAYLWSLVTNGLNYVLLAVVFVAEFIIRRIVCQTPQPSFKEYIAVVMRHRPHTR